LYWIYKNLISKSRLDDSRPVGLVETQWGDGSEITRGDLRRQEQKQKWAIRLEQVMVSAIGGAVGGLVVMGIATLF